MMISWLFRLNTQRILRHWINSQIASSCLMLYPLLLFCQFFIFWEVEISRWNHIGFKNKGTKKLLLIKNSYLEKGKVLRFEIYWWKKLYRNAFLYLFLVLKCTAVVKLLSSSNPFLLSRYMIPPTKFLKCYVQAQ